MSTAQVEVQATATLLVHRMGLSSAQV